MNKRHFYVVFNAYAPNSAPINRLLSYLKAWSQLDVEVTLVFMLPDRLFSQLNIQYKNIKVVYLWKKWHTRSYLIHNALLYCNIRTFEKKLKKGDKVYLYDQFYLANVLLKQKDVSLYVEITEHPEIFNPGHWPFRVSLERFLSDCLLYDGLFVISNQLKDFFLEKGVKESRIQIVNMTVDPSRFDGIKKNNRGSNYIAYCGTVSNRKDGVDQLIKSFSLISGKYPNLFLYIIGKVAPDDYNVLLAKKLGVGEKVVFTGTVPYSEMPQILTNARMLVLERPNNLQAKYGFPTKLGEYLLTANPIVVTNVGDIPMFIKDKDNGMVARPDDVQDFAEKIEWLLEHPTEATEIGAKGRLTALMNFNCSVEAGKIVNYIFN